ncbi:ubiquitin carboxyl-terminal hydrolase 5/13 [Nematocida minor]|uniref:ubiquitin carboxyl-terminal hydrolase 5/13 n=1 Tax=Nematocida minor TaxID=1912983 RepID=UPI00221EE6D7|nr:ubiquitin carboxyl-terminal hydrolase 5/13 [Nematocida minor]KAI5190995.1 ubiquitin carboxyl-terminal hydrolase 5/13 [Nematocida minor]
MFLCNDFTGECSYCFRDVYSGPILYCECSTEMCHYHIDKHKTNDHKKISIAVSGHLPDIVVDIEDYGVGVDKTETEDTVRQSLILPKIERNLLKKCTHLPNVAKITIDSKKCSSCDIDSNSWLCIECNKVFCGREQYGVEGKGHGLQHREESKGKCNTFLKIQSIDSRKRICDVYCYECDDMISHSLFGKIENKLTPTPSSDALNTFEISKRLNTKIEDLHLETEGSSIIPYTLVRKKGGLADLGNTCYISSILQAVTYCLSECMERFNSVYEIECDSPKECFGCQFKKVIKQIDRSHREEVETFSVDRLCSIVQSVYPSYTLGTQQDASEYFTDLISLVNSYDDMGHFNAIFDCFKITQEIMIVCDKCNTCNEQEEVGSIVYIGSQQKIQDLFKEEELPSVCDCGTKKKRKIVIHSAPKIFTVGIKRDLSSEEQSPTEESFAVEDKDGRKVMYTLMGAVIHKGTVQAGHYITEIPLKRCPMGESIYEEYTEKQSVSIKNRTQEESKNRSSTAHGSSSSEGSAQKKCKKYETVPKERAWVVYDNEKTGIQELLSSHAAVLFYKMSSNE